MFVSLDPVLGLGHLLSEETLNQLLPLVVGGLDDDPGATGRHLNLECLAIVIDYDPVALLEHLYEGLAHLQDQLLVVGDPGDPALADDQRHRDLQVGLHLIEDVDVALQRLSLEEFVQLS